MVFVCDDFSELKIVIRCALTATKEALTVEELWPKVIYGFGGGPDCVQLDLFDYTSFAELLKSIPDVVQLEDPEDENSIVNLVSSELSYHIENLVTSNIPRPPSEKNKRSRVALFVPYRVQCALIRIFIELYPEGLSIEEFLTEILCFPMFKPFVDMVDQLLYDLSHIFQRIGTERIKILPQLIDRLKDIEEKDKFSATDIYNIDEFSIENSEDEQIINNGIEYSLSIILEESIISNIELILDENPCGIIERKICDLYINKFGSSFSHFRRWGFQSVTQFFTMLRELCCVHFLTDEVIIIPVKNHICDVYIKTDLKEVNEHEYIISKKNKSNNEPSKNCEVFYKFLKNDPFLLASLDDCFLDREFQYVELKVNTLLNVNICGINTDNIPTVICQITDESLILKNLLDSMKTFYSINNTKFSFDPNLITMKHIYAYCLDDLWFRGSVIDVQFNCVKILNIDNGLTYIIPHEHIRLLHKKFSQLPAQALTCFLHGICYMDEDVLIQIINQKCTICIVSVDHFNKTAVIKIKLFESTSNVYLNEEWIQNGSAIQDSDSD